MDVILSNIVSAPDENKLSDTDRHLIALLQRDARRPNTVLARELRTTESKIRRRIEWLTRNGFIQFVAMTDPHKLGYSVWVIIQVKTNLPDVQAVADALGQLPVVSYVAVTTGAFDVLFTAHFRSSNELYEFLTKELSQIGGITNVQTSMILRLTKRSFEYGVPLESKNGADSNSVRDREDGDGTRNGEIKHAH